MSKKESIVALIQGAAAEMVGMASRMSDEAVDGLSSWDAAAATDDGQFSLVIRLKQRKGKRGKS